MSVYVYISMESHFVYWQDSTARNSAYAYTWQNINTQQIHSINQQYVAHTEQCGSGAFDKDCVQSLLIAEKMFHQPTVDVKCTQELTGLEKSLAAHTSVDNMDENNKFVCTECNKSKQYTYVIT